MDIEPDIELFKLKTRKSLSNMREYYKQLDFEIAVERAAKGYRNEFKMDSHQCRVGFKKTGLGASVLMRYLEDLHEAKTFEGIFRSTEYVKNEVPGLGDLWSYDTALKIGFHKNILPTHVYVQAGVKKGVEKIFSKKRKERYIHYSEFPDILKELEPYEMESFLCIWGRKSTSATKC